MLDPKTQQLIAIAASVVANCEACLDYHVEEARKAGASESDMRNAVGIARTVREAGEGKMDRYTNIALGAGAPEQPVSSACACIDDKCCG